MVFRRKEGRSGSTPTAFPFLFSSVTSVSTVNQFLSRWKRPAREVLGAHELRGNDLIPERLKDDRAYRRRVQPVQHASAVPST